MISRSTKSRSRRKGTVEEGVGLDCDGAVGEGVLLALILIAFAAFQAGAYHN
jgi:hypothetical protein